MICKMVKSSNAVIVPRVPSALRAKLVKRLWSPEEDEVLAHVVRAQGPGNWAYIAKGLPGRIGKQCRERWYNHLCPSIKKAEWSLEEKWLLFLGYTLHGSQWRRMTVLLPGRTDNSIKNCWNSSLKKLLGPFEARLESALETLPRDRTAGAFSPIERGLLEDIFKERTLIALRADSHAQWKQPLSGVARQPVTFNASDSPRRTVSPARGRGVCLVSNGDKENNVFSFSSLSSFACSDSQPCKSTHPPSTDHSVLASNSKPKHCFLPLSSPPPEPCSLLPSVLGAAGRPLFPVTRRVICFDFCESLPHQPWPAAAHGGGF